jgi:hypothetical protein
VVGSWEVGRRATGGCPSASTARSEIRRDRCSGENFNRRVCEIASCSVKFTELAAVEWC